MSYPATRLKQISIINHQDDALTIDERHYDNNLKIDALTIGWWPHNMTIRWQCTDNSMMPDNKMHWQYENAVTMARWPDNTITSRQYNEPAVCLIVRGRIVHKAAIGRPAVSNIVPVKTLTRPQLELVLPVRGEVRSRLTSVVCAVDDADEVRLAHCPKSTE